MNTVGFYQRYKTTGILKCFTVLVKKKKKKNLRVLPLEICICAALLSKHGFFLGSLCGYSLHPGCQAERLQFPLLPAESSSETLGWRSGPLGLWTIESSISVRWIEGRGKCFTQPAHSRPQSASQYTPTCSIPQKSFQVLFEREKSEKGKIRDCTLPGAQ